MKREWNLDELIEQFTLLPPEIEWLGENDDHNHLGKAILLKFFQYEGRLPESVSEVPPLVLEHIAHQLGLRPEVLSAYQWRGRRAREHRRAIRELYGFRRVTVADQNALRTWLITEVLPHEHRPAYLEQRIDQRLQRLHIEPPARGQIERLMASALHRYAQSLFIQTTMRLSDAVKAKLRHLIDHKTELATDIDLDSTQEDTLYQYPLHDLKSGAGDTKVNNIIQVAGRLKQLQEIGLPADLFTGIPLRFLRQYQQQTAVESISHLQRRANDLQTYTMLAAFCWVRQREITDQLVDLFIRVLKDIHLRAEYRVPEK